MILGSHSNACLHHSFFYVVSSILILLIKYSSLSSKSDSIFLCALLSTLNFWFLCQSISSTALLKIALFYFCLLNFLCFTGFFMRSLEWPTFRILRTKVSQYLSFFWLISRAMDETCGFGLTLWLVWISFSCLASDFTHIIVSIWWCGFYSFYPDVTRTFGICPSSFFIRMFYYTFVNRLRNIHAIKHIISLCLSNKLTVKFLHMRSLAPTIGHTIQKHFI